MEDKVIIYILKEFELCKDELKRNVNPQLYYLLLELKDIYKSKGINFSKNLDKISE